MHFFNINHNCNIILSAFNIYTSTRTRSTSTGLSLLISANLYLGVNGSVRQGDGSSVSSIGSKSSERYGEEEITTFFYCATRYVTTPLIFVFFIFLCSFVYLFYLEFFLLSLCIHSHFFFILRSTFFFVHNFSAHFTFFLQWWYLVVLRLLPYCYLDVTCILICSYSYWLNRFNFPKYFYR